MIRVVHPGTGSWFFYPSRIQGSKRVDIVWPFVTTLMHLFVDRSKLYFCEPVKNLLFLVFEIILNSTSNQKWKGSFIEENKFLLLFFNMMTQELVEHHNLPGSGDDYCLVYQLGDRVREYRWVTHHVLLPLLITYLNDHEKLFVRSLKHIYCIRKSVRKQKFK